MSLSWCLAKAGPGSVGTQLVLLGSCKHLEMIAGSTDVSGKHVCPGSSDVFWTTCELVTAPKLVGSCTAPKLHVLFVEGEIRAYHYLSLCLTLLFCSAEL